MNGKRDFLNKCSELLYEYIDPFEVPGALEAVEDALAATQPRWIPVSERLPEKHGKYLITATGESQGKKYIRVEIGQWLGDAFWIGWYEPNKKILAWMSLPQPWKGADDET